MYPRPISPPHNPASLEPHRLPSLVRFRPVCTPGTLLRTRNMTTRPPPRLGTAARIPSCRLGPRLAARQPSPSLVCGCGSETAVRWEGRRGGLLKRRRERERREEGLVEKKGAGGRVLIMMCALPWTVGDGATSAPTYVDGPAPESIRLLTEWQHRSLRGATGTIPRPARGPPSVRRWSFRRDGRGSYEAARGSGSGTARWRGAERWRGADWIGGEDG